MNFSELFIRRPVMTTLVMLGIVLFGIMGYRLLPVSARRAEWERITSDSAAASSATMRAKGL